MEAQMKLSIWKKTITSNIPDPHISIRYVNIDTTIPFEKLLKLTKTTIGGNFYEPHFSEDLDFSYVEIYDLIKPIDFFNIDYTIKTAAIKALDQDLLDFFIDGWNRKENNHKAIISMIKTAFTKC